MALLNFNEKKITKLQKAIQKLEDEKLDLFDEIDEYKKTINSFVNTKTALENEKVKLTKKYENDLIQLNKEMELEKKSVAKKVNAELSKIGITEFLPDEVSGEMSQQDEAAKIVQQFKSMPESVEKHEFFNKYEKIISKFIKQ